MILCLIITCATVHQFVQSCFAEDQTSLCKSAIKTCKYHCSLIKELGNQPRSLFDSPVPCLSQETVNNIEKFVFFIGYPRSGHSIIGSMMDAHPNMIIANEYNLFEQLRRNRVSCDKAFIFDELYGISFCDALCGWRSSAAAFKGYTLSMNDSWQTKFTTLKVIGDKKGDAIAHFYWESPLEFAKVYETLSQTLNIPFRVIHVVRNPYDMIATRVLFMRRVHEQFVSGEINATMKYDGGSKTRSRTRRVFEETKAVEDMIPALNLTVLEIHSADFIKDPIHTLRSVCNFLDLKCPEDYLQACYDKTYRSVSRTRDVLVWDEQLIEDIESKMKQYTFLRRYSFRSD